MSESANIVFQDGRPIEGEALATLKQDSSRILVRFVMEVPLGDGRQAEVWLPRNPSVADCDTIISAVRRRRELFAGE